jgi:hypothetical protein
MVLMGGDRHMSRESSNPMMMSHIDDEEKLKMMSDLESSLDLEEEELNQRDSIFKVKSYSKR